MGIPDCTEDSEIYTIHSCFELLLLFLKVGFDDLTPGIRFAPICLREMCYTLLPCPLGSVSLWVTPDETELERTTASSRPFSEHRRANGSYSKVFTNAECLSDSSFH